MTGITVTTNAVDAALETNGTVTSGWEIHGHALEVWEKSPDNPVCAADLAVDAFLKRARRRNRGRSRVTCSSARSCCRS